MLLSKSHTISKLKPLTLAVIAGLSLDVSAQQQDGRESQDPMEEIVVYGTYAGSLTRAQDIKQTSETIVDAISAEDIGKFPSENVAEALQLVPGVQIARDRGQGLSVSVRGLGPAFQITQLNGRNIAINENVENSGQAGRQFRYDVLPSDLIAGLEVVKAPTAKMEEGAIGGIVNIKTFKPLELDTSGSVTLKASRSDLAGNTDPSVSGLYNWKNDDDTFGILFSGSYSEREIRQDRAFSFNWIQGALDALPGETSLENAFAPQRNRPTLERQDRERQSIASSIQWKSSDDHEMNVDLLWSEFTVGFDEIGMDIELGGEVANPVVVGENLVSGTALDTNLQLSRETSTSEHQNFSFGINNEWNWQRWALEVDVSASKANSETIDPISRTRIRLNDQAVGFDYSAGFEQAPTFTMPIDITDISQFPGRRIEYRTIAVEDKDNSVSADLEYQLDGFFTSLEFGAKIRSRERIYNRRDIRISDGISGVFFGSEFFESFPVSDFASFTPAAYPTNFAVPNGHAFFDRFFDSSLISEPLTTGDKRNSYIVEEDIKAGYIMGNFESNGDVIFHGNLGFRVVNTKQNPSGTSVIDDAAQAVSFDTDYTEVLPSANINFELDDEWMLRTAVAKVISRPALPDLRPGLTFSTDSPTAKGGNPLLEPYEALQYDLSLEWYFDESGYVSAGLFYKDITTFVAKSAQLLTVNGTEVILSAPSNTGEGDITGLELAYQQVFSNLPAPFNNLGLQANYTYVDSKVEVSTDGQTEELPITGLSENSFNIVAFYEYENFAARIGYNWRDEYLVNNGVGAVADEFQAEFGTVDMSVSYELTDDIRIGFEGVNLTDEQAKNYLGDEARGGRIDQYGKRFSVSLNAKF